jgi:hypothetical protein
VATTENVYVDPSALVRLYLPQQGSREMAEWRRRTRGPLGVTHHGRVEMVNAISLARYRGDLTGEEIAVAWTELDDDFSWRKSDPSGCPVARRVEACRRIEQNVQSASWDSIVRCASRELRA